MVSIQGTEGVQTVYGTESKWVKPTRTPINGDIPISKHGIFGLSTLNDQECRQLLEECFSVKAITAQQGVILNCADTALTVTEIAWGNEEGIVDILQIARSYAFDVISTQDLEAVLIVAEILYGGSWQGRGTHSERKSHLTILDRAIDCERRSQFDFWVPPVLEPISYMVLRLLPSGQERQSALNEFKMV